MSCRRPSIVSPSARTESFHLGSVSSTIDLNRAVSAVGDRTRRGRSEPDRLGGSARRRSFRDALRKRPPCLFARSRCAHGHAAIDRGSGIRHLGVRRHPRGPHRRHRRRLPSHRPSGFEAAPASSSCAACARSKGYRALRDAVAASVRLVSVLPSELPGGIERLQAEAKDLKRQLKELQTRLAGFEGAVARRSRRDVSAASRGDRGASMDADQAGLKTIWPPRLPRDPVTWRCFSAQPLPSAVVIARARDATDRLRGDPQETDRAVRRKGRRAARAGAGWRSSGHSRRHRRVRARVALGAK